MYKNDLKSALTIVSKLNAFLKPHGWMVSLYGSVTDGKETPNDIDLIIVNKYENPLIRPIEVILQDLGGIPMQGNNGQGLFTERTLLYKLDEAVLDIQVRVNEIVNKKAIHEIISRY